MTGLVRPRTPVRERAGRRGVCRTNPLQDAVRIVIASWHLDAHEHEGDDERPPPEPVGLGARILLWSFCGRSSRMLDVERGERRRSCLTVPKSYSPAAGLCWRTSERWGRGFAPGWPWRARGWRSSGGQNETTDSNRSVVGHGATGRFSRGHDSRGVAEAEVTLRERANIARVLPREGLRELPEDCAPESRGDARKNACSPFAWVPAAPVPKAHLTFTMATIF
jgi:hypothetical protein